MIKLLSNFLQLPQNLLGLVILLVNIKNFKKEEKYGIEFYSVKYLGNAGISCGKRIIMDSDTFVKEIDLKHEKGHQIQSKYLCWLYLIIIGIPSLAGNIYHRTFHKKWSKIRKEKWYYNLLWEKQADKFGGVERTFNI